MSFETPIVPLEGDHLFDIARKRMACRSGELIDLSYWANKVSILSFNEDSKLSFRFGPYEVSAAHHHLVPAFAAMSLGVTGAALSEVLYHHGATYEQVIVLHYENSDSMGSNEHVDTPGEFAKNVHWVFNTLTHAISDHPELAKGMRPANDYLYLNPIIDLTLLNTPHEHLWPITGLEAFAKAREFGHPDSRSTNFNTRYLSTYLYGHHDLNQESNEEIIKLLHRGGVLFIVPENDLFYPQFFVNFFQQILGEGHGNLRPILSALNSIEDPNLIKQISNVIIEALAYKTFTADDDNERFETLRAIGMMDPVRYRSLRESCVLRLNIMALESPVMTDSPDTYLQRLSNELMTLKPSEFRAYHFASLGNLATRWGHPQATGNFDWHNLLEHVLAGFERKQAQKVKEDDEPDTVWSQARKHLAEFLTYSKKHMVPDYSRLKELPSASKVILATNGFDIKKLPGISNKHRGQLLSSEMGL